MDRPGETVRFHIIGRYIHATITSVENPPFQGDLVPQFEAMEMARRAMNCHLAIEVGLKALIDRAGGVAEHKHGLLSQLQRLDSTTTVTGDSQEADFLKAAFDQAVDYYNFNPNAHRWFRSLDDYFSETGGENAYEQYRYWILSQSSYPPELQKFSLPIHIEIMHAVQELLAGRKRHVYDRVENTVKHNVREAYNTMALPFQHQGGYGPIRELVQRHQSYRLAFAEVAAAGFGTDDEFTNLVFARADQTLKGYTDTAIRHLTATSFIQPSPPREIPKPPFSERHGGSVAEVHSPGGTLLGWVERRQGGLWAVEFSLGAQHTREPFLVKQRIDGLRSIVQRSTVEALCGLRGEQLVEHRVLGPINQQFGSGSDDSHYRLETWDGNHGWQVGDEIVARIPLGERPDQVLQGMIVDADSHSVVVRGQLILDIARERASSGPGAHRTA